MYEERKFKFNFNFKPEFDWKSLLIKLGILLLIVFIICFIIFRPKNSKEAISLKANINTVKEAAINYFKENMTLKNIGDYSKITLNDLEKNDFILKQEDSKGNSCDIEKSYAYLTKIRDDEFILKINMNCGKNEEAQTFKITTEDLKVIASTEDKNEELPKEDEEILVEKDEETEETPAIKDDDSEIADSSTESKEENNSGYIDFGNDKLLEELRNPNSTKKKVYKHIKYGEWVEGTRKSESIENSTKEVEYYKYCLEEDCVVDRVDNALKYESYTATYDHTENVPIYRYVYVVWSDYACIKGFTNTGIAVLQ